MRYVNGSGKVSADPHLSPDYYQKLITSRWLPHANVYYVWSTSVTAIVSYHGESDRTDE